MLDSPLPLVETFWRKAGVVIAQKESEMFSASPTAELPLVQRGLMGGKVGSPSPARPSPVLMKRTQEEMRGMTARPHITNRNR